MDKIKEKAQELVLEGQGLSMDNPDMEIKVQAYEAVKVEIADAKERIRRQKIDEARAYEPTKKEIVERLELKLEGIKKAKALRGNYV